VLTTTSGTPVAGRTIVFSVRGSVVCSAVTQGNGSAQCSNVIPGTLSAILNLGYTASFAGDASYGAASARGNLVTVLGTKPL
jgi:hypothetical protein